MKPRTFVAVFSSLVLLPAIQMITGLPPVGTINENRNLAPAPKWSTATDKLPREANDWFNDHFGLRPWLIRLKTQIDYSLFGMSDRVLIGRDGWLFYRSTVNTDEPLVESQLTGPKQAQVVTGMRMFTDALQRAGIRSVLVVNMMSDRFYADKLPDAAAHRPPHPHIDDLVESLRVLPSVHYVDSSAILKSTMKERQIFHKTDFHWNDPAAFEVAKAIADAISASEGREKSAWSHPLEIDRVRLSGGIATFMPLFVPPTEDALMIKPTYSWPPDLKQRFEVGVFDHLTSSAGGASYLPSTVFLGDSFLDGMIRAGLQSVFVATARARWSPQLKLSDVAAQLPDGVRWCVIQFIEVNLVAMNAFADLDDVQKAVAVLDQRRRVSVEK